MKSRTGRAEHLRPDRVYICLVCDYDMTGVARVSVHVIIVMCMPSQAVISAYALPALLHFYQTVAPTSVL